MVAELGRVNSKGVPKSFAVVSGKGGSGKTLVAVTMAQSLADLGYRTLLIDADFGTGGLTYYLTFTVFSNARVGLSELHRGKQSGFSLDDLIASPKLESLEANNELQYIRLIPTGDQRAVEPIDKEALVDLMSSIVSSAQDEFEYIIIDCRGGIDPQSIGVCTVCDAILIVAETDATSIQSTQHLVDILTENNLKRKVSGFVLNKVMDDPTSLAKAATSFFRSEYLGAIPFDIEATRCYIQGSLPSSTSLFSRHVRSFLANLLVSAQSYRNTRILKAEEFSTVTLRSPETRFGGAMLAAIALYLTLGIILYGLNLINITISANQQQYILIAIALVYFFIVLGTLSDNLKQAIGTIFSAYARALGRFSKK